MTELFSVPGSAYYRWIILIPAFPGYAYSSGVISSCLLITQSLVQHAVLLYNYYIILLTRSFMPGPAFSVLATAFSYSAMSSDIVAPSMTVAKWKDWP